MLVPGSTVPDDLAQLDPDVPVSVLHTTDEFAFDGALRLVAERYDQATSRWVAKSLQYPAPHGLEGSAWPWRLTAVPAALAALGLLLALLLRRGINGRAGRQKSEP